MRHRTRLTGHLASLLFDVAASLVKHGMMEDDLVLEEHAGGVATLTLNRPGARNALSIGLMQALDEALARVAADETVRVVVIAGAGPAFCAGHDLKEMTANNRPDVITETFELCSTLMQRIVHLPQPVIARVHGVATAAGCQLVASCDLAVAAQSARFATPGVDIGLFCSTPMVALSRAVAPRHALEMLFTGDMIDAGKAADIGLINRAVPDGDLEAAAATLAAQIAAKPAAVVQFGKARFHRQAAMGLSDAYAAMSAAMAENMGFAEAQEGITAFLEKRPPHWGQES